MKKALVFSIITVSLFTSLVSGDTFGTGANQFEIDFVTISGDASSANGTYIGDNVAQGFIDPGYAYRVGTYEITNGQWNKFQASNGVVIGSPSTAYDDDPLWIGTNEPINNVSWFEAAQFVNWLNTANGHQAAYKFTGTKGTSQYTLDLWDVTEATGGTNLYRHKDAIYFLPTENEWFKAAFWNGTILQGYATKAGDTLYKGTGSDGGWNYYTGPSVPKAPWDVGSGSEELNGTYDMMGNMWEWIESPNLENYLPDSYHRIVGGSYEGSSMELTYNLFTPAWFYYNPDLDYRALGFRVASIPEPATLLLLGMGGLLMRRRK